jgi:hypothetical protein
MVLLPPGDGCLRPVHELGLYRHDGVHLRLVPTVVLFVFAWGGKDVILLDIPREVVITLVWLVTSWLVMLVLLTSSRLRLQSFRELPSALL